MKKLLALCLLTICFNAHAALNKWIDADGKVHYSDTIPSDVSARKVRNNSAPEPTASDSSATAPKTIAEQEAEWRKSRDEASKKDEKEKENAKIKQKNCDNARSNLAANENSPLHAKYTPQGERIILDEAGRNQNINNAKKDVDKYCK